MRNVRCSDTAPHEFHPHEVEVVTTCSGQASCGWVSHPAHEFTETRREWCPGICDCGMGGRHGPGEHK